MRDTLYFKDDDARLSFLMGNYITLTNLTEREAQRIIDLRISPINVSVQATEPQLRRTLLGNKDADKSLEYMRAFGEAGIEMNGQIVVCPGWNDGEHLRRSIEDLMDIGFNSCSIVPVGLTKFRKGLAGLEPVTKEKAGEIIDLVDEYGAKCLEKYGTRMFFCADEFYIKAERPLPDEEYYEEYQQLDNGVGMLRSTMNEFLSGLEDAESGDVASFTVATGKAAEPFIARLVAEAKKKFPQLRGEVVGIVNDFFGHSITVSGLVTAQGTHRAAQGTAHARRAGADPREYAPPRRGRVPRRLHRRAGRAGARTQADDLRDRRLFALRRYFPAGALIQKSTPDRRNAICPSPSLPSSAGPTSASRCCSISSSASAFPSWRTRPA